MINIAFFSAKSYDEASFNKIKNNRDFEFHYHDFRLTEKTAKWRTVVTWCALSSMMIFLLPF